MNAFSNNLKTFTAGEALAANRRVKKSGNTVIYADAGEDSIGVTMQAVAADAFVLVKLWNDSGTFLITASGIIAANAKCYGANDGKVSATVSGEAVGTSNEDASCADGDEIEVLSSTAASQLAIQEHVADVAAVTQDALTLTGMTGTGNTSPAAETNIDTLGGTLTGTLDNTLADVGATNSGDVSAAINKNTKEIQAELVTQRALNTVLINNCKTFATQLNAARADNAAQVTKINAILAALEAAGIVKAS